MAYVIVGLVYIHSVVYCIRYKHAQAAIVLLGNCEVVEYWIL